MGLAQRRTTPRVVRIKVTRQLALDMAGVVHFSHPNFMSRPSQQTLLSVLSHVMVTVHQGTSLIFRRHSDYSVSNMFYFDFFNYYTTEFCI
jgi:hypothetical protein